MRTSLRIGPFVFLVLASVLSARAELQVMPDKENVVASRLEGAWKVERELTKRLMGRARDKGLLKFTDESNIARKIPARYETYLAQKQIYMAGRMLAGEMAYPFLLIEIKGNPHLVYFRDRDGQPMGDAESFNLFIAPAEEKANDLLFIGGDFNNQPFRALERADHDEAQESDEPVAGVRETP